MAVMLDEAAILRTYHCQRNHMRTDCTSASIIVSVTSVHQALPALYHVASAFELVIARIPNCVCTQITFLHQLLCIGDSLGCLGFDVLCLAHEFEVQSNPVMKQGQSGYLSELCAEMEVLVNRVIRYTKGSCTPVIKVEGATTRSGMCNRDLCWFGIRNGQTERCMGLWQ